MVLFKSRKLKKLRKQRKNKTKHTKYKHRRYTLKQPKRKPYKKTRSYYNARKRLGGALDAEERAREPPPAPPTTPPGPPTTPPGPPGQPVPPLVPRDSEGWTAGPSNPPTRFLPPSPSPPPLPPASTPSPLIPSQSPLPPAPPHSPPPAQKPRRLPPPPPPPPPRPPPLPPLIPLKQTIDYMSVGITLNAIVLFCVCILLFFCCYRRRRANSNPDRPPRMGDFGGGLGGDSILSKTSRLKIEPEDLKQTIASYLNFLGVEDHDKVINLLLNIYIDNNLQEIVKTILSHLPRIDTAEQLSTNSKQIPSNIVDQNEASIIDTELVHYSPIVITDEHFEHITNSITRLSTILNLYLDSPDTNENRVKLLLAYMSFMLLIENYQSLESIDELFVKDKLFVKFSKHLTSINELDDLNSTKTDYDSLKKIYDSL